MSDVPSTPSAPDDVEEDEEHPDPTGRRSDLTQDEAEAEAVGG